MTLEKQPDWIYNFIEEFLILYPKVNRYSIEILLRTHLPQEDTYQKTTVPNVLLYETGYKEGYQKGREDMKKEIRQEIEMIHIEGNIEVCDLESLLSPTDTK